MCACIRLVGDLSRCTVRSTGALSACTLTLPVTLTLTLTLTLSLNLTLTLTRHGHPDARLPAVAGEGGEALSAPRAEVLAAWMNGTLPQRVVLEIGAC